MLSSICKFTYDHCKHVPICMLGDAWIGLRVWEASGSLAEVWKTGGCRAFGPHCVHATNTVRNSVGPTKTNKVVDEPCSCGPRPSIGGLVLRRESVEGSDFVERRASSEISICGGRCPLSWVCGGSWMLSLECLSTGVSNTDRLWVGIWKKSASNFRESIESCLAREGVSRGR